MEETFSTVARFQYSSEAQIIKGRLEAEDIKVFLADQWTIDTDPLVSNAIGGIKLKVHSRDEANALQVLETINKYSVDDEGKALECPSCRSNNIEYFTNVKGVKSFFFLYNFLFNDSFAYSYPSRLPL